MFIELLSQEFSKLIREYLTEPELMEVNRLNKTAEYNNACATHYFLDANVVIDEAFTRTFKKTLDVHSDADMTLLNAAWNTSRTADFKN